MFNSKQTKFVSDHPNDSEPIKGQRWSRWANILLLAILPFLLPTAGLAQNPSQEPDDRPNIVLFVADDSGYSDFAPFGGEANTPAIDALASAGMKMTNYHVLPTCSVARSVLLTGVDNHLNGMGTMSGQGAGQLARGGPQGGQEGYKGYLNKRVVTIASLLKDAGYHTYHVGKWHLGEEASSFGGQVTFPRGWWPIDRGFEMSFGMLEGGGEHFGSCERNTGHCTHFFENDRIINEELAPDYFSGAAHTSKAIEFIDAGREADGDARKPFFLYFADTMSHEPNQVPDEYIKQEYVDMYYEKGWDGIRADRLAKMKELGLFDESMELAPRNAGIPDWNDESDPAWEPMMAQVTDPLYAHMWQIETIDDLKRTLAKKFAVYTGMVEYFDYEVGQIVAHLQDIDEYDNTVMIFFSDDGGDSRDWDWLDRDFMSRKGIDNSFDNIGRKNSFVSNGPGWAQVANTGLYGYKGLVTEGGIRVPMIVAYPGGDIEGGTESGAFTMIADVASTALDYAGVEHPVGTTTMPSWESCTGTYTDADGTKRTGICPMNGTSLRELIEGNVESIHEGEPIAYELFGGLGGAPNQTLYLEEEGTLWKLLAASGLGLGAGPQEPWRLYNLTEDPGESTDLAMDNLERVREMAATYTQYERNVGFIAAGGGIERGVTAGTLVEFEFNFTNNSDVVDTFDVSCESAWVCEVAPVPSNNARSSLGIVTLEPGGSATLLLTVSAPTNAQIGDSNTTHISVSPANNPQLSKSFTAVIVVGNLTDPISSVPTSLSQSQEPTPTQLFLPVVMR